MTIVGAAQVPIDTTTIKTLYVFVEIAIDSEHLADTVRANFPDLSRTFRERLLSDDGAHVSTGETIHRGRPSLAIEAPASEPDRNGDGEGDDGPTRLALVSTIQFVAAAQKLKDNLSIELSSDRLQGSSPLQGGNALITGGSVSERDPSPPEPRLWKGRYQIVIPRAKPLSPGEILGCTAPKLSDNVDALVYVFLAVFDLSHYRQVTLEMGDFISRRL